MNITLRQLEIFAAVARSGSFTRASEKLHLSQPAVSMQIRQLEEQTGMPLIERLGKKAQLTQAGREVYQYARLILSELEELKTVLDAQRGLERGRLRIAAISTANYFVPRLLGTFRQRYPGIAVSMDVTNREAILAQLADNEVDMAIMGQPPEGLDLEATPFMDNPLVIVAPPDHALAGRPGVPLTRAAGETFLVREPGSGTREAMERFFRQHDLKLNAGMEMGSLEAIKQSVQAGLGLALVPRDAIEMELKLGRLVILDVESLPIARHWYAVMRKGKRLSAAAAAFKNLLAGEARVLLEA